MNQCDKNLKEYNFNYRKCKRYFGNNHYFWEILIIGFGVLFFLLGVFQEGSIVEAIYGLPFIIVAIIITLPSIIYKAKFRIMDDDRYDDECFSYIDEIQKEAAENCGIIHLSNEIFTRLTIGGYSGINVKRVKLGKDGVSRSEAPEITVVFFLDDCIRYYSVKFYVIKRGGVAKNIGTIYYKDIMSVNYLDEIVTNKKHNCVFKTLKIIMNNGNAYEFAADEDSKTDRAITILTNKIAK